jgi:hypothetical protein
MLPDSYVTLVTLKIKSLPHSGRDERSYRATAPRQYQKHRDSHPEKRLRTRGLAAIDIRSAEGREALSCMMRRLRRKAGAACPFAMKVGIRLAAFDLWRLLYLQTSLIADANRMIVNRGKRELSAIVDDTANISFIITPEGHFPVLNEMSRGVACSKGGCRTHSPKRTPAEVSREYGEYTRWRSHRCS